MQIACYDRLVTTKKTDVQIRGVPVALRERLRRRADSKGVSMSQYVIEVLKDDLSRPTLDEWWEEVRKLPPLKLRTPAADAIRAARREEGVED